MKTQRSVTADERVCVCVCLRGEEKMDREAEEPDEASQERSGSHHLIGTLPPSDSFISKAIVCQCANMHYEPRHV